MKHLCRNSVCPNAWHHSIRCPNETVPRPITSAHGHFLEYCEPFAHDFRNPITFEITYPDGTETSAGIGSKEGWVNFVESFGRECTESGNAGWMSFDEWNSLRERVRQMTGVDPDIVALFESINPSDSEMVVWVGDEYRTVYDSHDSLLDLRCEVANKFEEIKMDWNYL